MLDSACLLNFNMEGTSQPVIRFSGQDHVGTNINDLFYGTYFKNAYFNSHLRGGEPELWDIVSEWLGGALEKGAIVGIDLFKPGAGKAIDFVRMIAELSAIGINLTNAQEEFLARQISFAISALGGGVIAMETPSGFRVIGTILCTNDAMINLAGLEHVLNISPAEAIVIAGNSEHGRHEEVMDFVNGRCGGLEAITEGLQGLHNRTRNPGDVYSIDNLSLQELENLIERYVSTR